MNKLNNINSKQDHILACLSSAPSNAKIIRTAARMAKAFDSQFTALFVETPDFAVATDENKKRLEENRKLAEQLGATIETVYGDDIPQSLPASPVLLELFWAKAPLSKSICLESRH